MNENTLCKGAWSLGSACRQCARCKETAAAHIDTLEARLRDLDERVFTAVCLLPPEPMHIEGRGIVRFEPPAPVDLIYQVRAALLSKPKILTAEKLREAAEKAEARGAVSRDTGRYGDSHD